MIDAGIRAVYFDAVGTLLFPRTSVARTYAEHACRHGATVTDDQVRHALRHALANQDELDRRGSWKTDEAREWVRWQTIVADVLPGTDPGLCFAGLWEWFAKPAAWTISPDAGEVLGQLARRGLTVGIASNFDARLLPLVAHFPELAPVRERCVISSLVGWRKPAPQFFAAVAQSADCMPAQVLYVGDDLANDLHGATAAGMRSVLLDPAAYSGTPDRIRSLRDLIVA